jgi:hypothetical protein
MVAGGEGDGLAWTLAMGVDVGFAAALEGPHPASRATAQTKGHHLGIGAAQPTLLH